jgi:DNA-binding LacI/PurR family transcriptional regulator
MGVTIRDVALRADVSVATVSRALRGHSSVLPATRARVEQAAAELKYTLPSRESVRAARVGVVIPHIGRWYYGRILDGIESVVGERGGELVVIRPFDRQNRRKDLLDACGHSSFDAVIVVSLPVMPREVEGLRERGISVTLLGTSLPGVSSVSIDDVHASATLTAHFIEHGHRRIGLVSSASYGSTPDVVARDRKCGYLSALQAAGLPTDEGLQVVTDFSLRGAQRAFEQLVTRSDPPTAIVAENDELAFGVLTAARAHGLDVPDDLSIGGIDDHEVSAVLGLTTIAQPVTSLGEVAAWQALAGSADPAEVVMPTSIIVRSSSRRLVP